MPLFNVLFITNLCWNNFISTNCHNSSGGGLSVRFEGQVSEDIILDVEDALVCLRVRSVPLQGDDCYYIEEGKRVLAACENNFQRFYFDAVVQKVDLSPRSFCVKCFLCLFDFFGSIKCI